jgi:hypothetical protein
MSPTTWFLKGAFAVLAVFSLINWIQDCRDNGCRRSWATLLLTLLSIACVLTVPG